MPPALVFESISADGSGTRLTRRTHVPESAAPAATAPARPRPTPPPEVPSAGPSQSSGSPSQKRSFVPGSVADESSSPKNPVDERHMDVDVVEAPPPSAQPPSTAKRVSAMPFADLGERGLTSAGSEAQSGQASDRPVCRTHCRNPSARRRLWREQLVIATSIVVAKRSI